MSAPPDAQVQQLSSRGRGAAGYAAAFAKGAARQLGALLCLAALAAPAGAGEDEGTDLAVDANRPVRTRLPWTIASELSWNGLSGLGLIVGWSPHPFVTLEAGGGGGTSGARLGLRARWNILTTHVTPFLAAGGVFNFGVEGTRYYSSESENFSQNQLDTVVTAAQGVGLHTLFGVVFTTDGGFHLQGGGGYLWCPPDPALASPAAGVRTYFVNAYAFATGSGPIVSIALGQAF